MMLRHALVIKVDHIIPNQAMQEGAGLKWSKHAFSNDPVYTVIYRFKHA